MYFCLLDKRDLSQKNHQKVEYASAQLLCQSHLNPEKKKRNIDDYYFFINGTCA